MRVLFLATEVHSTDEGGMESFNQRLIRCLAEFREAGLLRDVDAIAHLDLPGYASRIPAGVRYVPLNSSKLRTVVTYVSTILRKHAGIIVYGHVSFAPLFALGRLLSPGSMQVLVVHGEEVWERPGALRRFAVQRCIDRVIAVSRFTARRMGDAYGVPGGRFRLLANALDWAEAKPLEGNPPALALKGRWRLLSVSRLAMVHAYKNIDKVILALPKILAGFPDTHYYVLGDGTWRPALEEVARRTGVADYVHFLGRVDDRTRDKFYAQSDLFVLPSTGEGFGIVFLEAWRYGLPSIASDRDAASEVIQQGVDGLCVDPTPERIAEAVCSLLGDPARRLRMGEMGRRRLKEQFTHARFRESLREILAQCIPNTP